MIVVLSGGGAGHVRAVRWSKGQGGSLAAGLNAVVDETGEAAEALEVRGRPLVIVLEKLCRGREVVRLSGGAALWREVAGVSGTGGGYAGGRRRARRRAPRRPWTTVAKPAARRRSHRPGLPGRGKPRNGQRRSPRFLNGDAGLGPSRELKMLARQSWSDLKSAEEALAILDRLAPARMPPAGAILRGGGPDCGGLMGLRPRRTP